MAQVLKEEVKKRILKSAIIEFKEKGFENASMRKIARNARMTVGNLYRYFENKENLFGAIVDPIFNKLNYFLVQNSNATVNIEKDADENPIFRGKLDQVNTIILLQKLNNIIGQFFKDDDRDRLYILLMGSRGYKYGEAKQDMVEWIHGQMRSAFKYRLGKRNFTNEDEIYVKMISTALIEGLCVLINEYTEDIKVDDIFQRYIQFFVV